MWGSARSRGICWTLRLEVDEGQGGAVTLIQRFGSAANLNFHLRCLVLDGVYRCGADGAPTFVEVGTPSDDALQALLQTAITLIMNCSPAGARWSRTGARPTWPCRCRWRGDASPAQLPAGAGCDAQQGKLECAPLPAPYFEAWLQRRAAAASRRAAV